MASPSADSDPRLAAELPACLSRAWIGYGDVPPYLPDAVVRGILYEASRSEALLHIPDIARLHVRRDAITVSPHAPGIASALGPFLRRTPLMVLMLLAGGFCASGAALAGPDGAVVITGRTVSGKSTLAAALMKRGLRLMADDAAPLSLYPDGGAQVFPVWPEMILWQDAADALFAEPPPWLGPAEGEIPRRLLARERYCDHDMPLKRLYMLRTERLDDEVSQGATEGFAHISQGMLLPYQPELAAALFDPAVLLRLYGAIDRGRAQKLVLPQQSFAEMDELAERLIEDCGWSSSI